jgi:FlaA1/EpsC-like NDP-sugar epimerase
MRNRTTVAMSALVRYRRAVIIPVQIGLVVASNWLAFELRFDGAIPAWAWLSCLQMLPWLVAIRALTFVPFRLYEGFWRYTSVYDLRALVGAVGVSSLLFFGLVKSPVGPGVYPLSIFVTDAVLLTMMLGGVRLARRIVSELSIIPAGKRVLVLAPATPAS